MSYVRNGAGAAAIALIAWSAVAGKEDRPQVKPADLATLRCAEVVVREHLAYVAFSRTLAIQDVSKVDGPHTVGKVDFPHEVRRIALEGTRAYVAIGTSGVATVDITIPQAPVLLGRFDTAGSVRDVAVSQGIAFLADDIQGITIADLTDPTKPRSLASIPMSDRVRAIAVEGGVLAVADGTAGVRLLDVSKPAAPGRLGTLRASSPANDVALCARGRLLVGAGRTLEVYDLEERGYPRIASIPTPGPVRRVACREEIAAVACGDEGVLLVDLGDRASPRARGTAKLPRGTTSLGASLSEGFVFVAADLGGLGVVEISDPDGPRVLLPGRGR